MNHRSGRDRRRITIFPGVDEKGVPRPERRRMVRRRPECERLESRIAPAIAFQFNYSLDSLGFFTANPAAKTVLQEAGQIIGSQLNDNLVRIQYNPSLGDYWDATSPTPATFRRIPK